MADAGLTGATHFEVSQIPNACGYLAAAWAVATHKLGTAFDTLTLDVARSFNKPAFIAEVNQQLGLAGGHANTQHRRLAQGRPGPQHHGARERRDQHRVG